MNSQSSSPTANGGIDHVLTIAAATQWLLHPSAGKESCCIFKVRQCLAEINKKTYQPHVVSSGPYHCGDQHLEMIQQHKWRIVGELLARTPPNGPTFDYYRQVVAAKEADIRGCYSETLSLSSDDLVEMMVLDGLFTIELFCRLGGLSLGDEYEYDPLFKLKFIFANIIRDLFRFENQIPFFVLQDLFDESKASREDSDKSLAELALTFFNRPDQVLDQDSSAAGEVKHLLDLLRWSFIPNHSPQEEPVQPIELIQSAKKLRLAGIKFKKREAVSFLDIRFCNGVLEIPHIVIDDLLTHLLMNFVAFEQCYSYCSKHVTTYAAFMSCLIRTPADVSFLCDKNIIENYLGTDEEVVHFFQNLGKGLPLDVGEVYLWKLFKEVNEYHRNMWHVRWAGFRSKYFNTPWSFLSALAAVILLLITAIQTFFTVYGKK
ncbi:unnamed protein product [Prunus armeniaca]|uniref:Uncharacterized protein n=1 Tax=Prunus armeniaca TaxID=36596 RepID=A0A6J5XVS3_PRUAR|nr:unnamed protein product [Prunus armeniaca]CAB4317986.1 unnamed protein product [Prunus armeniaca]